MEMVEMECGKCGGKGSAYMGFEVQHSCGHSRVVFGNRMWKVESRKKMIAALEGKMCPSCYWAALKQMKGQVVVSV